MSTRPTIDARMKFLRSANRQLGIQPKINYGELQPQQQADIKAMQQQQRRKVQKQIQRRRAISTPYYTGGPTDQQRNALLRHALAQFGQLDKQSRQSQQQQQRQPVAGSKSIRRRGAIKRPGKPQQQPQQFRSRSGPVVSRPSRFPKSQQSQQSKKPIYRSIKEIRERKAQAAALRGSQPVAGQSHYAALQLNPSTRRPRQRQQKSHYATILDPSSSLLARNALQQYRREQASKQLGRRYAQQHKRAAAKQQQPDDAAQTARVIAQLRARMLAARA